jgi:hypothetical protein
MSTLSDDEVSARLRALMEEGLVQKYSIMREPFEHVLITVNIETFSSSPYFKQSLRDKLISNLGRALGRIRFTIAKSNDLPSS